MKCKSTTNNNVDDKHHFLQVNHLHVILLTSFEVPHPCMLQTHGASGTSICRNTTLLQVIKRGKRVFYFHYKYNYFLHVLDEILACSLELARNEEKPINKKNTSIYTHQNLKFFIFFNKTVILNDLFYKN